MTRSVSQRFVELKPAEPKEKCANPRYLGEDLPRYHVYFEGYKLMCLLEKYEQQNSKGGYGYYWRYTSSMREGETPAWNSGFFTRWEAITSALCRVIPHATSIERDKMAQKTRIDRGGIV